MPKAVGFKYTDHVSDVELVRDKFEQNMLLFEQDSREYWVLAKLALDMSDLLKTLTDPNFNGVLSVAQHELLLKCMAASGEYQARRAGLRG